MAIWRKPIQNVYQGVNKYRNGVKVMLLLQNIQWNKKKLFSTVIQYTERLWSGARIESSTVNRLPRLLHAVPACKSRDNTSTGSQQCPSKSTLIIPSTIILPFNATHATLWYRQRHKRLHKTSDYLCLRPWWLKYAKDETFRRRASSIKDRRPATLQWTLFIYLINKYISLYFLRHAAQSQFIPLQNVGYFITLPFFWLVKYSQFT